MFWLILTAISILLDRITKNVTVANLELYEVIPVIKDFFNITHIHNTGAAWGLFSEYRWLLLGVTIAIVGVIVVMFFKIKDTVFRVAAAIILGGALGNLFDRIVRGYVVDFLQFFIFTYEFPSFNVADISIVCGTILLGYYIMFLYGKEGYYGYKPEGGTGEKSE